MGLPKGVFRNLALVAGPLLLWMGAGWAAYPYMMRDIMDAMGETMDFQEARLFSLVMLPLCMILGVVLTVYGAWGPAPEEPVSGTREKCPACGSPVPLDGEYCISCGRTAGK